MAPTPFTPLLPFFWIIPRFRVFISTLLKTVAGLATPKGRAKFSGYREPNYHECPECNESVVQHLLVRHLIIEHDYDPFDAGEATGLVLRKSWDTDEQ